MACFVHALLCTCISCNNNLAGKHINSHGFRVPGQNNELAAISHICGSAWLNPCCSVKGSWREATFPKASTSLLIPSKWALYGFAQDCVAMISMLPCQCLSVSRVWLFWLKWNLKTGENSQPLIKSKSPSLPSPKWLPSPLLSSPPACLALRRSPGLGLCWLCGGGALIGLNHLALCRELYSN